MFSLLELYFVFSCRDLCILSTGDLERWCLEDSRWRERFDFDHSLKSCRKRGF